MAGIFGLFDYNKPGPGIPKDAPPKPRFVVFFEVLGRKFWKILRVNLMYGLFNLPAIIFLFLFSAYYLQLLIPPEALFREENDMVGYLFGAAVPLMSVFACLPLITVGPAHAGMTYILRNFSREEHAFLWSDFIEHAKKNFKQSMIVGTINLLVTIFILLDFYIIRTYMNNSDSMLLTLVNTLIIVAFVIFMMMSMYLYPMMVTFKLTIRQLYKNAFYFAIMKLIPNLLILLLCIGLVVASFYFYPAIGYTLFIFFTMALISFITNFYVYPKIDKYMIQPAMANEAHQENEELEKAQVKE